MINTHAKTNKWHSARVWEVPARKTYFFHFQRRYQDGNWPRNAHLAMSLTINLERATSETQMSLKNGNILVIRLLEPPRSTPPVSNRPKWNWNMIYNSTQFTDLIILGMPPPKVSIQTPLWNDSNWIKILPKKNGVRPCWNHAWAVCRAPGGTFNSLNREENAMENIGTKGPSMQHR